MGITSREYAQMRALAYAAIKDFATIMLASGAWASEETVGYSRITSAAEKIADNSAILQTLDGMRKEGKL